MGCKSYHSYKHDPALEYNWSTPYCAEAYTRAVQLPVASKRMIGQFPLLACR